MFDVRCRRQWHTDEMDVANTDENGSVMYDLIKFTI